MVQGHTLRTFDRNKLALLTNANAIMVVHNHPSGNPDPSRADKEVTTKLIQASNILNINHGLGGG